MPMRFGTVRDDLLPGAHNAIDTCLGIRRGERVALVADEASREVAASLEHALAAAGTTGPTGRISFGSTFRDGEA
jgi:leucyl aminopeptidase (aminopeptidase T)